MLHKMNMASSYLSKAENELSIALENLNNYVNINGIALYRYKVNDLKSKVNTQVSSIKNYIIPAIKKGD